MGRDSESNTIKISISIVVLFILFVRTATCISATNYIPEGYSVWAKNEIEQAYAQGIIPDNLADQWTSGIKRSEYTRVAIHYLAMQFGVDEKNFLFAVMNDREEKPFIDTNDPYVLAAWYLGIINGRGNGIFDPESIITREEAAKILYRTYTVYKSEADYKSDQVLEASYTDFNNISDWAQYEVVLLKEWDVMRGVSDTEFHPKKIYTREQCYITFLRLNNNAPSGRRNNNVCELYINNTSISLSHVLQTAQYFNEPLGSTLDFLQHRNLYGFLMNNAYRLMRGQNTEIINTSEKGWVKKYRIPESIVRKTAEILLGITDNLPEAFYRNPEFGYEPENNVFLFSPFSPPMINAEIEGFEQTDGGELIFTISLRNIDSSTKKYLTYYFSFTEDSQFKGQYKLIKIV